MTDPFSHTLHHTCPKLQGVGTCSHGFPFSSQTNQGTRRRAPEKGKLISSDGDSGLGFAAFAMLVTSLSNRTYSYHANNAGLHMSCSALAWGRSEHVSEITQKQGAFSHVLSDYARRGFLPAFLQWYNLKDTIAVSARGVGGQWWRREELGYVKKMRYDVKLNYILWIKISFCVTV